MNTRIIKLNGITRVISIKNVHEGTFNSTVADIAIDNGNFHSCVMETNENEMIIGFLRGFLIRLPAMFLLSEQ